MKDEGVTNSLMATNSESCFASRGSIFAIVDNIHWAIASAKHNKAYVLRFVPVLKQITKVLNGADVKFIRQAEFYSDLKETLYKIEDHVKESSTRGKWMNRLMAKKNQKSFNEFEKHVDDLITRIVFSFAQRVQQQNMARQKKKPLPEIPEEDELCECKMDVERACPLAKNDDTPGEGVSLASQEDDVTGER